MTSASAAPAAPQQVPGPPPTPTPFVSLKAAFPFGEPLGGIGIPGNTRAVVAQGAALSIVDLTTIDSATNQPRELQAIEIPEVSTIAMSYRLGANGERQVFIAGGTTGLWEIDLCDALFTSSNPPPCPALPTLIDRVGCEQNFSWKRCVDVAYVEGNSGAGAEGLLLALFSASSDIQKRTSIRPCGSTADLGATELRAYRIVANGTVVPYSSCLLSPISTNPSGANEEIGLALATDPGDPNVVFVSLGWGGIRQVDITTTAFTVTPIPVALPCGLPNYPDGSTGCPAGEQVRDIAVVRTPTLGRLLYAAMEHGRVAEVQFPPNGSLPVSVFPLNAYFPGKIAATAYGDEVLVAVGLHENNGLGADASAPFRTTGVWTGMCINVGIVDANNISNDTLVNKVAQIRFLTRNATNALAPLASTPSLNVPRTWNALEFLPTNSPGRMRLYASTSSGGLRSVRAVLGTQPLSWAISDAWPGGLPFNGKSYAPGAPTLSLVNNAIGGAGLDGFGAGSDGHMFAITTAGGVTDVNVIPNTVSACPVETRPYPTEQQPCPAQAGQPELRLSDPKPFILQSSDSSAQWLDPYDPAQETEWFVSGDATNFYADPATCTWLSEDLQCRTDPCPAMPSLPGNAHSFWGKRPIPGATSDVGWLIARLKTGAAPAADISGLQMNLAWWQVPSPNEVAGIIEKSPSTPFTTSTADPRTIPIGPASRPVPKFVYLVRNGSSYGIKIARTQWLMDRADASTPACPAGNTRGNGEPLASPMPPAAWGPGNDLELLSLTTHVEIATSGCSIAILPADCIAGPVTLTGPRFLFNNHAHVFSVPDPNQPGVVRWILGVAAGFVATTKDDPNFNQHCPWKDYYRRALTVFYDVTNLSSDQMGFTTQTLPPLLAAGLGPPITASEDRNASSHAFALRTQQYATPAGPRTFAYVADLLGRVLVYDVSWDKLQPPAPVTNPLPGTTGGEVLLALHASHSFRPDPYDGLRPNCTDVEIDQGILYCATVRGGVHLLEIHAPPPVDAQELPTFGFLDTPGVATGIVIRHTEPLNPLTDQMLVGDNRCGLRIYSRIGN